MKKLLTGFLISLFLVSQCFAAVGWDKSKPAGTTNASDIDTNVTENFAALDLALSYLREGCKLTYSTGATLIVEPGSIVVSNSAGTIRLMVAKTSNTSVTFSDIDTGAEASSQTYYVYAICTATTDVTYTIKISTNASTPSGVTYYKRLGYFYNNASSNITQVVNDDHSDNIAFVKGQGNYYKVDSGTSASVGAVSFSFTFASAPVVVLGMSSQPTGDHYQFYVSSVTTTGFTISNYAGLTASNNWLAIGQVLAQ